MGILGILIKASLMGSGHIGGSVHIGGIVHIGGSMGFSLRGGSFLSREWLNFALRSLVENWELFEYQLHLVIQLG